jgi:hydroxymethylbilane synthase
MSSRTTLRLGTRGSLLARAQSLIVRRALRAADPGLAIELVTIATRGDNDRSTPLAAVRDPGFFSAEIDAALLDGEIDFAVHSMKDLPLGARPGIMTAAIPEREDPRDVVVFRPEIADLIRAGEELRIGSSSERRADLTREFLDAALPRLRDFPPRMRFPALRGPVEQRLARIRLPRADERALDGVVLAIAGLSRLWGDRDGHASIAPLLEGTRLMVLPLSRCPTAPGQGALVVECRSDDPGVARQLAAVHDAATARRARRELDLLAAQPEADRNGFGASTVRHERCGTLLFVSGRHGPAAFRQLIWQSPARPAAARAWDGADWVRASSYRPASRLDIDAAPAIFLAHWRALPPGAMLPPAARVWASGVESWQRLARGGQWVEGCADNLGFDAITATLAAPVLRLPPIGDWTVLTRSNATSTWQGTGVGRVLATYSIAAPEDADALRGIHRDVSAATHFFWGSPEQYRALRDWLPANSHHACGPGKTFIALQADGVRNLQAFPSRREWRAWLA